MDHLYVPSDRPSVWGCSQKNHLDQLLKMSNQIEKSPSNIRENAIDHEKGELVVDRHADLGLQHLAKHGRVEFTPEEEKAVRWKIDLCLMPIV